MKKIIFLLAAMMFVACQHDEPELDPNPGQPKYTSAEIAGTWKATHYDSPNDNLDWISEPMPHTKSIKLTPENTFSTSTLPIVWGNSIVFSGNYTLDYTGKIMGSNYNLQGMGFSMMLTDASHGTLTFFNTTDYQVIMQYKVAK